MMTHEFTTTIQPDGTIVLKDVPFPPGESVRVLVTHTEPSPALLTRNELRGSMLRYDDPFAPAAPPAD